MEAQESSYYPPRARWYSPLWYRWLAFYHGLQSHLPSMPKEFALRHVLFSMLVPGYGFRVVGHPLTARVCLLAYGVLGLVFIVALGHGLANLAMGLMIGIHGSGVVAVTRLLDGGEGLFRRLALSLVFVLAMTAAVYLPLRNLMTQHVWLPLQTQKGVVVVNCLASLAQTSRGDMVAYEIGGASSYYSREHGSFVVREGFGLDRILAVAGDEVRFDAGGLWVSGERLSRGFNMPTQGAFVVPPGKVFVWPSLGRTGNAGPLLAAVPDAMLKIGLVDESRFRGVAFGHWFGRKQNLP